MSRAADTSVDTPSLSEATLPLMALRGKTPGLDSSPECALASEVPHAKSGHAAGKIEGAAMSVPLGVRALGGFAL